MNEQVLKGIEPAMVMQYFEEICSIPHGSGNIQAISDYLVSYAVEKGLRYVQEPCGNVIIFKEASPGYESEPGIILQGHMDMVAVWDDDCRIDMLTDGLELFLSDGLVGAKGTSLGGDDGIALAYAMAILADDSIPHPALEFVATINEETGMDGAIMLDTSVLRGRRLINIDSEEEGSFLTGCAGGATLRLRIPTVRTEATGKYFSVRVDGLQGGHSGTEIHKNRANAILILARVLRALKKQMDYSLVRIDGGTKDNAIPVSAEAVICCVEKPELSRVEESFRNALSGKEDGISITATPCVCAESILSPETEKAVLDLLTTIPFGVAAMSTLPGLVETSDNVGIIRTGEDCIEIATSVRSMIESEKEALCEKISTLAALCGATVARNSEYPGWQYRMVSPLREKAIAAYRELYGAMPKVETIHAGLECGLLIEKLPDLDAISMGPDIYDIHTTKERLSIASVQRTWELLKGILAKKDCVL